jgi:hypothetical protein
MYASPRFHRELELDEKRTLAFQEKLKKKAEKGDEDAKKKAGVKVPVAGNLRKISKGTRRIVKLNSKEQEALTSLSKANTLPNRYRALRCVCILSVSCFRLQRRSGAQLPAPERRHRGVRAKEGCVAGVRGVDLGI